MYIRRTYYLVIFYLKRKKYFSVDGTNVTQDATVGYFFFMFNFGPTICCKPCCLLRCTAIIFNSDARIDDHENTDFKGQTSYYHRLYEISTT